MSSDSLDAFYALLGVEAGVDADHLQRVWRTLARRWHPDHAGAEATAMFQKISAAYQVLSDPVARAAYDRRRNAASRASVNGAARSATAAVSARRRAPSVMISRVSGPLASLLACGIARRAEVGLIDLFLSAEEVAQG